MVVTSTDLKFSQHEPPTAWPFLLQILRVELRKDELIVVEANLKNLKKTTPTGMSCLEVRILNGL